MKRAAFTALSAAAAGTIPLRVGAQALTTIRFGTTPVESYALAIYTQEAGFFKKHGIDAQLSYFNGGGAVLAALLGGSFDYATVNWGAIGNAHAKNIPIAVIAAGGLYSTDSPTTILAVAKNNSTIHTGKDLNGKTIGVSTIKDLQQASIMQWVDANGGDSATLKFVEIPIPQIPAALDAGRLDAGIVLEPILTAEKDKIRVLAKCYDAITKKLMISAEIGMTDYLNKNVAQTKRVVDALNECAVWANANHEKAGEILTRVAKISPSIISTMARSVYSDKIDLSTVQPVIDASAKYHFLADFKAADLIWKPPAA